MRLRLGTKLSSPPGPKYREQLGFAEVTFPGGLPKPSKLRPWTNGTPAVEYSVVAPQDLMFDDEGRVHKDPTGSCRDKLSGTIEALDACYLVLDTGRLLTPGQRDRDRFAEYCRRLAESTNATLVWRAGGLWEHEAAELFAQDNALLLACNPFDTPQLPETKLYLQLDAEGVTKRFGEDHFLRLIDQVVELDDDADVAIAIDSPRSFREATRCLTLMRESGLEQHGRG